MPLPSRLATFLADHPLSVAGATDHECEGAKFHSPTPLYCQQTELAPGVPGGPTAWLCGTCRDNLSVLREALAVTDGALEWPVRREFGNQIRALASRGWEASPA